MSSSRNISWTIILNPHAGGGKGMRHRSVIENLLHEYNIQHSILLSEYPKHAILLTKRAIESGSKNFIVVGGDGTLNEVVNGIFQQKKYSPNEITVGMIPVGTGNDWIKTFGIPNDYREAIAKICERKVLAQDVGIISFFEKGLEQTNYFSNMAGFGFDALVTQKANAMKEKGRSGKLVYVYSLLLAYAQYKTNMVKLLVDGEELEDLIFNVSIGIGKYNGGGMKQSPYAVPDNGIFEVTCIKKIGLWGIITNLAGLYNGNYVKDWRVISYKAKRVQFVSNKSIMGEADGESLGEHQFSIEILPQKLRVIVGELR